MHQDLAMDTRKITKIHKQNHKMNRKTNCRKLNENNLADEKWEYAVTLDEALIYLDNSNGQTRICYVKKGESVPDN